MKERKSLIKLLCILVVASMIVTLVSCSKPAEQNNAGGETKQEVTFPESGKSIRMIITHGVGGSVDTAARGIAPFLEKYLGVPVVTENMVGAGGRRAMEYVFAAEPDGYTIVVSAFPSRLIGELLYPESKYKMKEFVHLGSWVGGDYRSIIVAKNCPYQTFEELMAASKEKQLKAAGGGGLGSTSQLQTVYLKEKVGLNADFIPFDSTAEVANAVIGGHVDFGVMPLSSALRFRDQGEVNIIAVHAPKRTKAAPEVPTLEELGYKGVVIPYGVGAWAPPGTPKEIQDKYAEAIAKAVKDPEFLAWAEKTKVLLEPMGPEEFLQTTLNDYERISSVIPLLQQAK